MVTSAVPTTPRGLNLVYVILRLFDYVKAFEVLNMGEDFGKQHSARGGRQVFTMDSTRMLCGSGLWFAGRTNIAGDFNDLCRVRDSSIPSPRVESAARGDGQLPRSQDYRDGRCRMR